MSRFVKSYKSSKSHPRKRPGGLSDVEDPTVLDNRLTDGGEVVLYSPETLSFFNVSRTHFW
jgi:hypothetical protein